MADNDSEIRRRVIVLGTGGTIAGRAGSAGDNVGYTAGQVGVTELLEGIAAPAGIVLQTEQVAQVDSKDMSFSIWRRLAERCAHWLAEPDVAGLVVTHGTDTLGKPPSSFSRCWRLPSRSCSPARCGRPRR
jgi:L-asparaginase